MKFIFSLSSVSSTICLKNFPFPLVSLHSFVQNQLTIHVQVCLYTLYSVPLIYFFDPYSEIAQSCPILCDPMDCSLQGFSVHGILQARKLEWVAMPSSRGSFLPRDQTSVSCVSASAGRFFTTSVFLLLLLSRFSRAQLCATPQTAARQAPPSLGFSRQEYTLLIFSSFMPLLSFLELS